MQIFMQPKRKTPITENRRRESPRSRTFDSASSLADRKTFSAVILSVMASVTCVLSGISFSQKALAPRQAAHRRPAVSPIVARATVDSHLFRGHVDQSTDEDDANFLNYEWPANWALGSYEDVQASVSELPLRNIPTPKSARIKHYEWPTTFS